MSSSLSPTVLAQTKMGLSVFLDQKISLGKVCFQHFPNSMFVMLIQHVVDEKKLKLNLNNFRNNIKSPNSFYFQIRRSIETQCRAGQASNPFPNETKI